MRNFFNKVKNYLETNYASSDLLVTGDNYPPSQFATMIASVTGLLWMGGLVFLMLGKSILTSLQIEENQYVKLVFDNKMVVFIALFMLNNVGASFLATGAFEVYLDKKLIFSKLMTNRVPSGPDLFEMMIGNGFEQD